MFNYYVVCSYDRNCLYTLRLQRFKVWLKLSLDAQF